MLGESVIPIVLETIVIPSLNVFRPRSPCSGENHAFSSFSVFSLSVALEPRLEPGKKIEDRVLCLLCSPRAHAPPHCQTLVFLRVSRFSLSLSLSLTASFRSKRARAKNFLLSLSRSLFLSARGILPLIVDRSFQPAAARTSFFSSVCPTC